MQAPASVIDLVKKFERNLHAYKSGTYNETQVRVEFINPFFEALGWDVYNKSGYSEQYKDVIHEFSLKTQEYSNAPDYLFKVGTMKKFFVEAKKPVIYIKEDIHPAYQLRRYAWSAKLPLSILTDFEEFAVYDCRLKPNQKDKASVARRLYYTFREYPDMWGEIHSKFSREAVLQGEYDKFAEGGTRVKGTEVDDAFLQEIEGWRDSLARNIALRNPRLSGGELNYSVQKIIDRIIFLRICEGRGIEEFKELHNLSGKTDIYKHLITLFKNADKKYNSGLFHFTKEKDITEDIDNITPVLSIDDKIFKDIIESLYYPKSPYEFSVFGAEILGHVYEQFLGKVIRLTAGHQAKVEEKPEVKKAGGVYYTPAYIVDYIVKNTLGKKLEEIEERGKGKGRGKEIVEEAAKLRVLDPACGSGSFLLGAYQYLLDWHIKIYQSHEKEFKERVYRSGKEMDTDLHLTTKEKKRILLNNIYGVDIDSQAVEVSKLSLLLKVLEGETDETLAKQLDIFTERALPDLSKNIKCGNSLIDTDYYDNKTLFEQETSVNPFNWQKGFPDIFKNGGFDVVIGNPPYVRIHELNENSKIYFRMMYELSKNQFDLYQLFYEKGLQLLKKNGLLGYISSNKFCITNYGKTLREILFTRYNIINLVDCSGNKIFGDASTYPIILIVERNRSDDNEVSLEKITDSKFHFIQNHKQKYLLKGSEKIFSFNNFNIGYRIVEKMERIPKEKIIDVYRGRGTSKDLENNGTVKAISNKEISRYKPFDHIYFRSSKSYQIDYDQKILMKKVCFNLECTIDLLGEINPINTVYVVKKGKTNVSLLYLLALLNSPLLSFYARNKYSSTAMRGGYIELRVFEVEALPLYEINFSNCVLKQTHDKIVNIVDQLLKLNEEKAGLKMESEINKLQTKIDYCEDRINKIVYELYGLTEEEIKIVEGKE